MPSLTLVSTFHPKLPRRFSAPILDSTRTPLQLLGSTWTKSRGKLEGRMDENGLGWPFIQTLDENYTFCVTHPCKVRWSGLLLFFSFIFYKFCMHVDPLESFLFFRGASKWWGENCLLKKLGSRQPSLDLSFIQAPTNIIQFNAVILILRFQARRMDWLQSLEWLESHTWMIVPNVIYKFKNSSNPVVSKDFFELFRHKNHRIP